MRNLFTVIVAVALLAVAQAQESPPPVAAGFAERFKYFDHDGDGKVSREEFGDPQDNVTQAALRFLAAPKGAQAEHSSTPEPGTTAFVLSYAGGTRDAAGRVMGGTELRNLAAHGGKLYAGVEMWMDRPSSDPASGAQILVLDKTDGFWRLEHEFAEDLPAGDLRSPQVRKKLEEILTPAQRVRLKTLEGQRPSRP